MKSASGQHLFPTSAGGASSIGLSVLLTDIDPLLAISFMIYLGVVNVVMLFPFRKVQCWNASLYWLNLQNIHIYVCVFIPLINSAQSLSCVRLFVTPRTAHARLPCPSPTPGAYSNSRPLCWWCHPTISSSVVPFSSCLQSFPASRSFTMSPSFASDGQGIGASASALVLPMNIQDWFPLGWTGWIPLQCTGLSRVFSNTIVQKH